jgi:hypothetical protein
MVLAFLLAALSVAELQGQQTQLAQGSLTDLPRLYRDIRGQFIDTWVEFVGPLSDETSASATSIGAAINKTKLAFDILKPEFEARGRAHGLTVQISLANGSDPFGTYNESQFVYNAQVGDNDNDYCEPWTTTVDSHGVWRFATLYSYNGSYNYTGYAWNLHDAAGGDYEGCTGMANDGFIVLFQAGTHVFRGAIINIRVMDDSGASVEEYLVIHFGASTAPSGNLARGGMHSGCPPAVGQPCT